MKLLSNKFFYFLLFNLILNIFSFKIKENYYKELLFPNKTKERNQKNKENYFFYNNLNKNEKNDISFISSLFYSSIFNLNYNYLQIKENTNENDNENEKNKKRLLLPDINNPPDGVDSAICVICRNLEYCTALNGLLIQEVYYPESNAKLGTCHIIDQLGERMYNEIFGIGRTFRDTPQCRTIVMQYLCLFWGTENDMYTNLCYWKEDTSNPDPTLHEATGRPPCRSFCVQVNLIPYFLYFIYLLYLTYIFNYFFIL